MTTSQGGDRVPPHDLTAEKSLIGSMLLGADVEVSPGDFAYPSHAVIYQAVCDLRHDGCPIDLVAVKDRLSANGTLDAAGGERNLLDVAGAVPTSANAKHYAGIVQRHAKSRRLIALGTQLTAAGYDGTDTDEASGEVMTALVSVADTGKKRSTMLRDVVKQRLIDYRTPTKTLHFPGTHAVAHFGDPTIIAGDTGSGKTAYAIACADDWRKHYKVLFLTYEMSAAELTDRFISRAVGQSSRLAYEGLSEHDVTVYKHACSDLLADRNLIIKECAGMSVGQLSQTLRIAAANGTEVVVLDYAQIAADEGPNENAQLTTLMHRVQGVSKSTGMAIIMLSQYNRDKQGRPALRNLRGSGALEQEAANVLLMWSPSEDDAAKARENTREEGFIIEPGETRTIVRIEWAKRRHGRKGMVEYYLFDGASMTFEKIDEKVTR